MYAMIAMTMFLCRSCWNMDLRTEIHPVHHPPVSSRQWMTSSVTITDRGWCVYPPGHTTQASPNVETPPTSNHSYVKLKQVGYSLVQMCSSSLMLVAQKNILNGINMSQSSLKYCRHEVKNFQLYALSVILNGRRRPRQQIYWPMTGCVVTWSARWKLVVSWVRAVRCIGSLPSLARYSTLTADLFVICTHARECHSAVKLYSSNNIPSFCLTGIFYFCGLMPEDDVTRAAVNFLPMSQIFAFSQTVCRPRMQT